MIYFMVDSIHIYLASVQGIRNSLQLVKLLGLASFAFRIYCLCFSIFAIEDNYMVSFQSLLCLCSYSCPHTSGNLMRHRLLEEFVNLHAHVDLNLHTLYLWPFAHLQHLNISYQV